MKNKLEGSDGIETLNKMGFMAQSLDAYSEMFLNYVIERKQLCL